MSSLRIHKFVLATAMGMVLGCLAGAVYAEEPVGPPIVVVAANDADAELAEKVQEAIDEAANLQGLSVEVSVRGLEVTLEGDVPSEEAKNSLMEAVRSADERIEINDLLAVAEDEPEDEIDEELDEEQVDSPVQKIAPPKHVHRPRRLRRWNCFPRRRYLIRFRWR